MIRSLIVALAALSLASAAQAQTQPQDTLKLAIGQRGNWENSVSELGQDAGFFKQHGLKLEPEFKGNGYLATGHPRMPRALYEAIRELEESKAAREIFGDDVVEHYLNAARVEQETYDAVVHPWDRERYLERG